MTALTIGLLAAAVSFAPPVGMPRPVSGSIPVDCSVEGALQRAIAGAVKRPQTDIVLNGLCRGPVIIESEGVSLRGASPASGLFVTDDRAIVIEARGVSVGLSRMVVRGGEVATLATGANGRITLSEVEVQESEVGALASDGARVNVFDSTVEGDPADSIGVVASGGSTFNVQRSVIRGHRQGIVAFDNSSGAVTGSTVEDNASSGITAEFRSDINVGNVIVRNNGQVQLGATRRSDLNLLADVTVGEEDDETWFAISASSRSVVQSFVNPTIHGDVGALDAGAIRLGNTRIEGDLVLREFSDAFIRDTEIVGLVACFDGSDARCDDSSSAGTLDCPSTTCGAASPAGTGAAEIRVDVAVPSVVDALRRLPARLQPGAIDLDGSD